MLPRAPCAISEKPPGMPTPDALLLVLNPRRITRCIDAIAALPIDKAWLQNYTEHELCAVVPRVLAESDHDLIGVISDDAAPTPDALERVLSIAEPGTVVTGYCRLDEESDLVNLSTEPLPDPEPTVGAYTFPTVADMEAAAGDRFRTWFAGHCLTFMWRDDWHRFPWMVFGDPPGCASDFMLSWRLQEAGVPIYAHSAAYVEHVKRNFNALDDTPGRELLIGREPAGVKWEHNHPKPITG